MVAQLVVKAVITAAQIGFSMSRKIEGPRSETKVSAGDYGAPWPRGWGTYWINPPAVWGKDLVEVRQRRKTKGGKYNDYTYFGSGLLGLACHELAGIRRAKADNHLVYDLSGAGPVSPFQFVTSSGGKGGGGSSAGESAADYLKFYPGTFTQEIDPVVAAEVEAKHGEGSATAYLGRSVLRYDGLPLEKFGNRIPQWQVEVVGVATPNYPYRTAPTEIVQASRLWNFTYSTDFSRFMWVQGSEFEIWDNAAGARMIAGDLGVEIRFGSRLGMYANGNFRAIASNREDLLVFSGDGGLVSIVPDAFPNILFDQRWQEEVRVLATGDGSEFYFTLPYSIIRYFYTDAIPGAAISDGLGESTTADLTMKKLTGVNWAPCEYFNDLEGRIWAVGRFTGTGVTTAYFKCMVGGSDFFAVSGLAAQTSALRDCTACVAPNGQFVLAWDFGSSGHLYAIDPATGTVTNSLTTTMDVYNTEKQFSNFKAGASTIWLNGGGSTPYEVDLNTLTVLRSPDVTDWLTQDADGIIYNPTNHSLICFPQYTRVLTERFLDRLGAAGVTLGQVVSDVCQLAGIDLATIDVSALTQTIPGYHVSTGTGRDWLEPLLDLYDIDPRPHGFQLQFLPRGGAAGAVLSSEQFVSSGDEPAFSTDADDGASELPKLVTLQFADTATEQQPNTAMSPPQFEGGSQKVLSLDMSNLALTADSARQLVARLARRMRFDARTVRLSLPASQLELEPGDVRPLDLRGVPVRARLQAMAMDADRRIVTEWKRDDASVAVLDGASGASADGHGTATIAVPLLAKGFVLDLPLLSDLDEGANPVVYLSVAPYADGTFPGATIYQAIDGEYSEELADLPSTAVATWGYASDVLGDANPNLWDRLGSVNVKLQVGALTGCTENDIDADPKRNRFALRSADGWEIGNFTTATLEGDGSYTLTGLKRGQCGTEQHCGSHALRDVFLLLDQAMAEPLPLSLVGTDQSFKAVTGGRTEAGAFPINLTPFTGASKKPLSPVHLRASKDAGTGDWTLSWVRRTRIGGRWTSGTTTPLGEISEAYEVEIMDGTTVKRTITGLTGPAATWTAAQQTTDFGSGQSTVTFRVYQISDSVGRGFVAQATVSS